MIESSSIDLAERYTRMFQNIYGILRFKRDPHPHQMEDDLFSMKGWSHQRQESEYGGDVGVAYVTMTTTRLAGSDKPIFDKQGRSVHLAAIARNRKRKSSYTS
jgi:hypothetical protein